jgi:hypothetical protein
LRWALSYALTDKQWKNVKDRYKAKHLDWEQCSCPKKCQSDSLDEHWVYEKDTHTKILIGMKYICRGCHWLKSLSWRIKTWLQQDAGQMREKTKPDHIIDCLGWAPEEVYKLKEHDMNRHRMETGHRISIKQALEQGKAVVVKAPTEMLPLEKITEVAKPGQRVIMPWRVNLAHLVQYDFTTDDILKFEQRMYNVAEKRMSSLES